MLKNVPDKNRKTDIILVLKPIDGKPKNSTGLVDRQLFTGENNLHAIMDTQTCLWHLKYDRGVLPPHLRDKQFTGYSAMLKYVKDYMLTRNIEISEIRD